MPNLKHYFKLCLRMSWCRVLPELKSAVEWGVIYIGGPMAIITI